jgi:hypothetical protein
MSIKNRLSQNSSGKLKKTGRAKKSEIVLNIEEENILQWQL